MERVSEEYLGMLARVKRGRGWRERAVGGRGRRWMAKWGNCEVAQLGLEKIKRSRAGSVGAMGCWRGEGKGWDWEEHKVARAIQRRRVAKRAGPGEGCRGWPDAGRGGQGVGQGQ
eukprot:scaffold15260_cov210-Amphora_coffeaeformis.AAC.1